MKIFIAGIGAGDCGLITLHAIDTARRCDVIIVPRSKINAQGTAEKIMMHYFPDKKYIPVLFPMTNDENSRRSAIHSQVEAVMSQIRDVQSIFFPVIGDAMLYSTGRYFVDAVTAVRPEADIIFIPGISAHSLAASCARRCLAINMEIFTVIPGTAETSRIKTALDACDCAAIYKPTAIQDIHELVTGFNVVRVDYAGFPELERIYSGKEALENIHDYLSIMILWREDVL